ncbi:MAG: CPBP family intramembrane metalloprotease [Chloroflexi bacterium]|nr:CPBP family intramembrane metalloprotease [Ktedonobacteraceae bacterium]MBV9020274.1 CPBP family intramembrane metalloprotease [Ktedonobacteraceae bacterium]MBV9707994.1 CPBP family intramembrane metalloprotease [Chloroflexota bacterium]
MASLVEPSGAPRNTVADTWRWMKPDLLWRIIPLTILPLLYSAFFHLPLSFLGLALSNVPQQLSIGIIVGIVMALFAALYRVHIVGPWFRRPTFNDHLLQSVFYVLINGPVEELFFRGFLLAAVTQWTGWLGWGCLVSIATYTLYHRLGKWNWRSVFGVCLAGLVFTLVYITQSGPRSLLAVSIVHSLTTSGFLNGGDEVLYWCWKRRKCVQPPAVNH